ncbi:putative hydro-lyase [Aromatoleum petrolei]|uniref:Putative hydro-lyase GPA26_20395 n=1 Tax=Aromatoleum petrolei TaxID=76116 RepID=A0ABX1MUB2_9RHOO|nr:putative hydro-lyase [Aromatoleum petrolei]
MRRRAVERNFDSAVASALELTTGVAARRAIRAALWTSHTSGMAPGHVQGNVAILRSRDADEFLRFCQRNPKPCPLLAVSEPGEPLLPTLGADVDIRFDVPRYRVWRKGELVAEPTAIDDLWEPDFVTFVIGCSFSFEQGLLEAGIPLRHIAQGRNVAMYRTNIPTSPAGQFHGPLVVSMRPMTAANAIRAIQVTSRLPNVHGAPVHFGDPAEIGIADLAKPDFGDPVEILPGEVPVYWACGVTPQSVVMEARPELCITHAPGSMLVTDLLNNQLAFS